MELDLILENLELSIGFELDEIAEDNSLENIGGACERIAHEYRSLAICKLLADADTDAFYHNLIRSGQIRFYYLSRCHRENRVQDSLLVASLIASFFDAVTANQFRLAIEMSRLSSRQWSPDDEYEDDFCYARFLYQYVAPELDRDDDLEGILSRFQLALEGKQNARWNVCKSLLAVDQAMFNEAYQQLIDERTEQIEEEEDSALGEEMTFLTEKHIFVEGLAILKIAERVGLQTEAEYLYCPAIARLPMTTPFPNDGYPRI